jgi:LysR family transcriptional regulator, low CO2-responsive transcriptional regulator
MTSKRAQRRSSMAHRETEWALDLELRQLRAFVLLVESGSMSAASRLLGIAQSTMSEGIIALERALGTTIVVRKRGGRGIALTVAGETLLPYARRVIESLEDAHAAVAAVDRDVRTRLEVIANESIGTYLLPTALAEVRKKWPRLRFAVTVGMCPSITEGLATARYDVGLMLQTGQRSRSDVVSLAEVPLVLFCRVDHPLATRAAPAVSPEHLANCTIFISDARGYFFDLIRQFLRADGLPGPRLEGTGSVEGVKRGVLADDLGLGVLPHYAIADEVRAARFATLRIRPDLPRMRLAAMSYRTRPPVHPAVAALLDAVRHNVGNLRKGS